MKDLCEDFKFTSRTIYIDRYYTSVEVVVELRKWGLYVTGTLMAHRIHKEIRWTAKKTKEMARGDHETHMDKYTGDDGKEQEIGLVIWKDSKPVYILTSGADCSVIDKSMRRNKGVGE